MAKAVTWTVCLLNQLTRMLLIWDATFCQRVRPILLALSHTHHRRCLSRLINILPRHLTALRLHLLSKLAHRVQLEQLQLRWLQSAWVLAELLLYLLNLSRVHVSILL
jgi:hypothetical protein